MFTDVKDRGTEEFDKDGHSAGVDDDLGVLRSTRGNVGESPSGLKLQTGKEPRSGSALRGATPLGAHLDHGVGASEKLDKAVDDSTFDNTLDRRIALLR